jgi:hypothetical protein
VAVRVLTSSISGVSVEERGTFPGVVLNIEDVVMDPGPLRVNNGSMDESTEVD